MLTETKRCKPRPELLVQYDNHIISILSLRIHVQLQVIDIVPLIEFILLPCTCTSCSCTVVVVKSCIDCCLHVETESYNL